MNHWEGAGPGVQREQFSLPMRTIHSRRALVCSVCLLLAACNTISLYDQAAYQHATDAKVDTLALMDKATTSYSDHLKAIEALELELAKAAEYDAGRPMNQVTTEQWKTLRADNGILNRFFRSWKNSDALSATFINDKKEHIAREFDDIIRLESGKIKSVQNP
jgi:hypothetical protein